MLVTINTSDAPTIDWAATGADEIAQNVFTLLNTDIYEVAYDRTLGMQRGFVDASAPEAVPVVIAQIYDLISNGEPRASVEDVTFKGFSSDGSLIFEVVIDI